MNRMRKKYYMISRLLLVFLVWNGVQACAQEAQKFAPNNIPVPWYSQKIAGYPYSHCSLASSLMVFDYFKGMTADTQRTAQDAKSRIGANIRAYGFPAVLYASPPLSHHHVGPRNPRLQ